jgi:hypothetical protein
MAGTVGLRFNVDVGNAPSQVENITKTVAALNKELAKATEEHDYEAIKRVAEALNNATSARGQIMQQANQAQNAQARENMSNGGIFGGQYGWLLQNAVTQITDGFIKILQDAHQATLQRARGNYGEAAVLESKSQGEAIGGGLAAVATAALGIAFGKEVATVLAPVLNKIGVWLGGEDSRKKEEGLAYSAQYKNVLPFIDSLNQLYGGAINSKTLEQNNEHGLRMYGRAAEAAAGTGLTTNQLIEAMKEIGGYGVKSETQALDMAHNQALWSRFTGADLSTVQKYAGQAYRFGGDTGAVSTAYGGLMAQNMGKGQFSVFLNSMERILEEGIAKGFVRSSEEIAGNMAMLYKLSGNSALWQGEQGAQQLSQMNAAISNATNLQSVGDVISFGAARDMFEAIDGIDARKAFLEGDDKGGKYTGTYVDYMQLLERGVSAELLERQFKAVEGMEGGNIAGMIERFRGMYGLNYTGAAQVWDMSKRMGEEGFSEEEIAKRIKELQADPNYKSDSELLQTAINKMTDNLVNIGKFKFDDTELAMLQSQADNVASILAELRGETLVEDNRPQIARDYNISTTALTDRLELPGGSSVPANYYGPHFGAINVGGEGFNAQLSALASGITGGRDYSRDPMASGIYGRYFAEYNRLKNDDGIISESDVSQLIPVLRELARVLGKEDIFRGKTNEEIHVFITE